MEKKIYIQENVWKEIGKHRHTRILQEMKKIEGPAKFKVLFHHTVYMVAKRLFRKDTDSSVTEMGTELGIYSEVLKVEKSHIIDEDCSLREKVQLCWVPGHSNVEGIQRIHECDPWDQNTEPLKRHFTKEQIKV